MPDQNRGAAARLAAATLFFIACINQFVIAGAPALYLATTALPGDSSHAGPGRKGAG